MMSRRKLIQSLQGVMIPVVTPMDAGGRMRIRSFEENLRKWRRLSLRGFVVCGSTGEMPYLRPDERLRLFEAARKLIKPPQLLVATTGLESTQETIRLSRRAANLGVDLLLVITPNYFRPKMTSAALQAHFETIADSVKIPLMIYSIPPFTGLKMEPRAVGALAQHPNIIGIKESSGDAAYARKILRSVPSGFRVFLGSPLLLLKGLQWGTAGGILGASNFIPDICLGVYEAYRKKDWKKAQRFQRELNRLGRKLNMPFGVAGIKAAGECRGLAGGPVRSPLLPLKQEERRLVQTLMQSYSPL